MKTLTSDGESISIPDDHYYTKNMPRGRRALKARGSHERPCEEELTDKEHLHLIQHLERFEYQAGIDTYYIRRLATSAEHEDARQRLRDHHWRS